MTVILPFCCFCTEVIDSSLSGLTNHSGMGPPTSSGSMILTGFLNGYEKASYILDFDRCFSYNNKLCAPMVDTYAAASR